MSCESGETQSSEHEEATTESSDAGEITSGSADEDDTDEDDTEPAADPTPADDPNPVASNAPQSPATPTDDVMIECEELTYAVTCDDPMPAQGYYACSDYFGEILGVRESCSAGPNVDVREGTPCGEYEFPVGSCIYYTEAVSDRCYITHVGAEAADLVEAGQTFWEFACAGTWVPAD
jgi:hypothetical protein